jgi:tetratricopeptide (TPR) repeat protein
MNEKASSALQKAQQERKRGQFPKAIKRLEQAIEAFPDELDLYVEAIDVCIDGGELLQATNFLKTAQEKFTRERERLSGFIREKLQAVHDPSLARCVVEHAVKRRDLEAAFGHLGDVPDHIVRELLNRSKTKKQSLKSASHGGYSLRGEQMTNELTSALLAARLGQMKEAMETFVQVLEEKPVEQKMVDPFLAALEVDHPKSGRIRFARACSFRAAGLEADAVGRFIEAARLEPACAAACAQCLKAMRENAKQAHKVERGLAEVLLIKGDLDDAAAVLREYLVANPENGREVIMLLRPYIDPAGGINPCTWFAIETALKIEQSNVALDILRPLQQRGGHAPEIFEWLEARAKDGFASAEIMMFHGSLAIEQKQFERAGEIMGAVCAAFPQSSNAVLAMIDRHRGAHPSLEALFAKYAEPEAEASLSGNDDSGDFQMFDNKEFHLDGGDGFETTSSMPRKGVDARFGKAAPEPDAPKKFVPKKGLMDAAELSLDDSAAPEPSAPPEPKAPSEAAPTPAGRRPTLAPSGEITELHVNRVAQKLYEAGAAAFFHVDRDAATTPSPPVEEPTARTVDLDDEPIAAPPELAPASEPAIAPEPAIANEPVVSAEPQPAPVIARLERAAEDGRLDELEELLAFEPADEAEDFARSFYRAEYQLLMNRPLQALQLFGKLDTPSLAEDRKRRVWFKTAVCQRSIRDFAAARQTLERLLQAFPGVAEYERLAQRNYEQYLEEQNREAPVLEKTTSLD